MDDGNESQNGFNKSGVESGRATSVLILDAYPFESLLQLFAVIFQLGQVSAHRRSSSSPGRIGDNRRSHSQLRLTLLAPTCCWSWCWVPNRLQKCASPTPQRAEAVSKWQCLKVNSPPVHKPQDAEKSFWGRLHVHTYLVGRAFSFILIPQRPRSASNDWFHGVSQKKGNWRQVPKRIRTRLSQLVFSQPPKNVFKTHVHAGIELAAIDN